MAAPYDDTRDRYRDLVDVVADLAGVSDPAALASRIAEQARRLLRADVVYLWLSAPDRADAFLGATSGGLTSRLRDVRIPFGQAMAGKIIDTGLPLISARYLDDGSFTHVSDVDAVMREERIVAAAGVPLGSELHATGALIAANRDARPYTPADVELLRSLAVHAAICVERAEHAQRHERAVASLTAENQELLRRNAEAADLHNTFARVALTGGQLGELVNEVIKIVRGQLAVIDEDGRVLAEAGGFVSTAEAAELARTAGEARTTQTSAAIAAVPIVTTVGLHGVFCLHTPDGIVESDVHVVERAAVTAALVLLRAEAEARAAGFRRDDFVNDLVTGSDDASRLIHRAAQMKFDLRRPYTVHVVRAQLQDRRLAHLANEAARTRGGLAGHSRRTQQDEAGTVVVLLPGLNARTTARELAETMKRAARLPVSVSGAGPVTEDKGVRSCFDEAEACSEAMVRIAGYDLSGTLDDLGFVGLVLGKDRTVRSFIDTTLAPVIEYDHEHHSELLRTLEALLTTDGGPTAAAHTLHVHVSTVKQRMQRLQALLGDDWRSVDRAFELRLALRLHRIDPR